MALKRLALDGYGQIELNQVAFRRDSRIEAQCALGEDFSKTTPAENGMLLAVDNVKRIVRFPVENETLPVALNYSTEHIYDERTPGLKNFALYPDSTNLGLSSYVYPRLGYLSVQDKINTNCVCYDDSEFADDDAFVEALENVGTTPLYGGISTIGAIKVSATKPTVGPVLLVRWEDTMPDGQRSVAFYCIKD